MSSNSEAIPEKVGLYRLAPEMFKEARESFANLRQKSDFNSRMLVVAAEVGLQPGETEDFYQGACAAYANAGTASIASDNIMFTTVCAAFMARAAELAFQAANAETMCGSVEEEVA